MRLPSTEVSLCLTRNYLLFSRPMLCTYNKQRRKVSNYYFLSGSVDHITLHIYYVQTYNRGGVSPFLDRTPTHTIVNIISALFRKIRKWSAALPYGYAAQKKALENLRILFFTKKCRNVSIALNYLITYIYLSNFFFRKRCAIFLVHFAKSSVHSATSIQTFNTDQNTEYRRPNRRWIHVALNKIDPQA